VEPTVNIITLPLPLGMGSVNCYLVRAGLGYVLIDTGAPNARGLLRKELERLGCTPGELGLILLTHGDFDHIGNAASVRGEWRSRIAMHRDDARMAEVGDMFVNRQKSNPILKTLVPKIIGFGKRDRFAPDVLVEDGTRLSEYGFGAEIISIPGHSRGSIGILCADGSFFCGDLLDNTKQPSLNAIIDDREAAIRSAAQLRSRKITTIYPGHGQPFSKDRLADILSEADATI
jgi:hydroxyacylglutathione hydrolase